MKRILCTFFSILLVHSAPAGASAPSETSRGPDRLTLPESVGKIEERFTGTSARWVICIQDVHAHFAAQENIAALLDRLSSAYRIQTVATEGSWSDTSYPKTWGIPPTQEKQSLLRALLEQEQITGPAYAAMFSKMPITLIGMEDAAVYEKNRDFYLKYLDQRDAVASKLKAWEEHLTEEKKKNFNPDLWNFDLIFSRFQAGEAADKTIPAILQWADEKQIPTAGYGELALFRQVTALEKTVQKTKLESEAKRLTAEYKNEQMTLEELLQSGKIPTDKLEHYPQSKKYLELMVLRERTSPRKLFSEIGRLGADIKQKLFAGDAERALDAKADRLRTAKQLMLFKAVPEDFEAYERTAEEIQAEAAGAGLSEGLQNAAGFYAAAKERDEIFFKKITEDPRLKETIAVVAGGFHTEGLTSKLKQAGISYLVIAPDLGKQPSNEALYVERIREEVLQAAVLSAKQNRENDDQDARIAAAIRGLTSKKITDLRKAVEMVARGTPRPRPAGSASAKKPIQKGFLEMPENQQRELVNRLLEMQKNHQRIVILLKASTLAGLIVPKNQGETRDSELALIHWKDLIGNRANQVVLLNNNAAAYQQILGETLGKSVKRVPGGDLDAAIAKEKDRDVPVGVIDPSYAGTQEVLTLKPVPAALFLIRPLLEDKQYQELFSLPEAVQALQKILTGILLGELTQKSA